MERQRIDVFAVVALAFLCFLAGRAVWDRWGRPPIVVIEWQSTAVVDTGGIGSPAQSTGGAEGGISLFTNLDQPEDIIAPYEQYELTQGPHGFNYGHMAIDISAGDGAPILSPVNAVVTALFVDNLGNTTIMLENEIYRVTLLHGIYNVAFGARVELGQVIGRESNQGNTYDALGRSCRGRDCGYHTHLNIYDKRLGANVDPLSLFD